MTDTVSVSLVQFFLRCRNWPYGLKCQNYSLWETMIALHHVPHHEDNVVHKHKFTTGWCLAMFLPIWVDFFAQMVTHWWVGEGVGVSVRRINTTEVTMSACFTASADKHQKRIPSRNWRLFHPLIRIPTSHWLIHLPKPGASHRIYLIHRFCSFF